MSLWTTSRQGNGVDWLHSWDVDKQNHGLDLRSCPHAYKMEPWELINKRVDPRSYHIISSSGVGKEKLENIQTDC